MGADGMGMGICCMEASDGIGDGDFGQHIWFRGRPYGGGVVLVTAGVGAGSVDMVGVGREETIAEDAVVTPVVALAGRAGGLPAPGRPN